MNIECGSRARQARACAFRLKCRSCNRRCYRHRPAKGENLNRLEETISTWPVAGATLADRTRRVYDRLAGVYPLSTMFFHSRAHRCALRASGLRDGMRVLEVATGSGEMFRRLVRANRKGSTVGVDLSPNMAARTQRRAQPEFPGCNAHRPAVD